MFRRSKQNRFIRLSAQIADHRKDAPVPACVEQLVADIPNGRRIIWVKCRGESQCMLTEPLDFVKDMAVLSHRVMHLQQLNLGEQLGPGSHAGLSSVTRSEERR